MGFNTKIVFFDDLAITTTLGHLHMNVYFEIIVALIWTFFILGLFTPQTAHVHT